MTLIKSIIKKFKYAFSGMKYAFLKDHSVRLQALIAIVVLIVALLLRLSVYDFLIVTILCAMVLVVEMLNSALELLSDYVCDGEYSQSIKKIKDLGAGAVLTMSLFALVIGVYIFSKYIF